MRSSSGEYYEKLDHVRAVAAFLVFIWHAIHGLDGAPVPFGQPSPVFPLALLDEGHVGVAVFMTLSGYLFAKILASSKIYYPGFLWNRFLRLAPLLVLVATVVGVREVYFNGFDGWFYLKLMWLGFIYPYWPNGGWSIAVELHFYLILPLILFIVRRSIWWALALVGAAILLRLGLYLHNGEVQSLAYWTLVGRFDQFVLGIFFFHIADRMRGRHLIAASTLLLFCLFYYAFDRAGGYHLLQSPYPSTSPLWIVMPTIEGGCVAALIAYYDATPLFQSNRASRALATIGGVSYSIYLLHFFIVFKLAGLMAQANFGFAAALAGGTLGFFLVVPFALMSFRFIEAPFLAFRVRYKTKEPSPGAECADSAACAPN